MIFNEVTDNGIRVVGEIMPSYRSVALGIWVSAGPVYECDNERGISHFIEHMLFKGTKNRTAEQIAVEMDMLGGNLNAFTAKECTCFYVKVLDKHLATAADILSDMLHNPKLDKEDVEREAGVICEEILMNEDSPEDVAHEKLSATYYEGSPLAYPILGTYDSVKAITSEDMQSYMDRMYVPNNIVIACAGNFSRDELIKIVNEKFCDKKTGENVSCVESPTITTRKFASVKKDIEQAQVCLALPGYSIDDRLQYPLLVLNNCIGGTMSSRLFQSIREKRGLAYSVYSFVSSYSTSGYFSLYAGTGEAQAKLVIELMLNELKNIKESGISEEEFTRNKNQLRDSFIINQESTSAHSSALGKAMLLRNKVFSPDDVLKRLEAVTMDDIREVIDKTIDFDRMAGVVVSRNKDNIFEGIEKLIMEYK